MFFLKTAKTKVLKKRLDKVLENSRLKMSDHVQLLKLFHQYIA